MGKKKFGEPPNYRVTLINEASGVGNADARCSAKFPRAGATRRMDDVFVFLIDCVDDVGSLCARELGGGGSREVAAYLMRCAEFDADANEALFTLFEACVVFLP